VLFEVISDASKTFEGGVESFKKAFNNKGDQFKACSVLCYLIENNLLEKHQRILSFFILYELYNHENVQCTPFEAVVLASIQNCISMIQP